MFLPEGVAAIHVGPAAKLAVYTVETLCPDNNFILYLFIRADTDHAMGLCLKYIFLPAALVLCLLLPFGNRLQAWEGGGATYDLGNPVYGTLDWMAEEAMRLLPEEETDWFEAQHFRDYLLGTEAPQRGVVAISYSIMDEYEDSDFHFLRFDETYQTVTDDYLARRAEEEFIQAKRYYKQNSVYQAAFHAGAMAAYIARAASFPRLRSELDLARLLEYEREVEKTVPAYAMGNMESLRTSTVFQQYITAGGTLNDPIDSLKEEVETMAGRIARGEGRVYHITDMNLYLPMGGDNSGGGVGVNDWTEPFKDTVGLSINDAVNVIARALHDIYVSTSEGDLAPPVFESIMYVHSTGKSGEIEIAFWEADDDIGFLSYNIYLAFTSNGHDYRFPSAIVRNSIGEPITYIMTGLADSETYYVSVRAMDRSGNEETNTKSLPAAVGLFTDSVEPEFSGLARARSTGLPGEVLLQWPEAVDESVPVTYLVFQKSEMANFHDRHPTYSTTGTEMLIQGLTDGDDYSYLVRAQDNLGNRETNINTLLTIPGPSTDVTPPSFEGLVTAFATGNPDEAVLTWDLATDPSLPVGYNVYLSYERGRLPGGFPSATSYQSPYVMTGLTPGTGVYVIVRAVDNFGNEDQNTTELLVIPSDGLESDPPEFFGLQSAEGTGVGGEIVLGWYPAFDISTPVTYAVYQSTESMNYNFEQPALTTQGFTARFSGLQDGQQYYYVVRAFDRFGNNDENLLERSAAPRTSADTTPPVFAGIASAEATGNSGEVIIRWPLASDDSTPITYRVYRSVVRGEYDFEIPALVTPDTSFTMAGLLNNREYFFVVRAADAAGNTEDNTREASAVPTDSQNLIDTTPPAVVSSVPAASAVDVRLTSPIRIRFSEPLDPSSLEGNILVLKDDVPLAGELQVEEDGSLIRFVPWADGTLTYRTWYTVRVLEGVTDTAANHITAVEWTFLTVAADGRFDHLFTYPNPVRGEESVTLFVTLGAESDYASVSVMDMNGRVQKTDDVYLETGTNKQSLTVDDGSGIRLMPGTYYVLVDYRGVGREISGRTRMVIVR